MAGILYLVATPIGNLGDLSPRAVETLAQADFIAAEDTRVSLRLLNHFDIMSTTGPPPAPPLSSACWAGRAAPW